MGLGTELLRRLVEIGRAEGVALIRGYIVPENAAMQNVAKKLGFALKYSEDEQLMIAELALPGRSEVAEVGGPRCGSERV
jgi:acetyltransferase